jgi:hypothetical protein
LAAALSLTAPLAAHADEVTRAGYREAAEPICQKNTEANERILVGVRADVRQERLGVAAAKLGRAAGALEEALAQLRALPPPAADQARLAKWLEYVKQEVGYFELASQQLKAGKKTAVSKTVVRLTRTAGRANAQVVPFAFKYCRFQPSRFT